VTARALKVAVLSALVERYEVRDIVLRHFERAPDRAERVRCSAVAEAVANELNVAVSWVLRRRVRHAAKLAGWGLVIRETRNSSPEYAFMRRRA
jgi:hypothetical protein